ncbi:hypothetical protein [Agreia sp. COWG]|uniref:hypothetical protein n=1 Tax=Agreia sp. COWG TaxID=2773266 RepID=UPI0019271477|nr:hypothetical protein [Agreia sp. COWG]CAD6005035.1 conserved protein of unknown function [Agreia sp. COWG]
MTTRDDTSSPRFDVREFASTARGNHRSELQLERYADARLSDDAVHLLRYLGRLESATMEQLRNLLVTATHKDARVTAFLVTWAFEKFWIADAIDQILIANGSQGAQVGEEGPPRSLRSEGADRRGPIRRAVLAMGQGVPLTGMHMATGLIDEWVMRTSYQRLITIAGSPTLETTIEMFVDIKSRHEKFFSGEARRRLAESTKTVKQTTAQLAHAAWPIGAVDRSHADRTFFAHTVFGGADGLQRATSIGHRVAELPGLTPQTGDAVARKLRS